MCEVKRRVCIQLPQGKRMTRRSSMTILLEFGAVLIRLPAFRSCLI